jgi:tellurite resistance protein
MYRSQEDVRAALRSLFDSSVQVAMADGVITADERAILDAVKDGVAAVDRQFMEMLNESHDDEAFQDLVGQIFGYIVGRATEVALGDGVITPDEQAIIENLVAASRGGMG